MQEQQAIFKKDGQYFLVDVFQGKIYLKVKENGWGDTWSLSLDECDSIGNLKATN